jgi:hypothetical protein
MKNALLSAPKAAITTIELLRQKSDSLVLNTILAHKLNTKKKKKNYYNYDHITNACLQMHRMHTITCTEQHAPISIQFSNTSTALVPNTIQYSITKNDRKIKTFLT